VSGRGIAVDGSGTILVAGSFRGTVDFDPESTTASLTAAASSSGSDIFIASYSQPSLPKRVAPESAASITLHVAPNPFSGTFTLGYNGGTAPARIEIIDMMGRVVESREVDGATEVTLGVELPAGAYIVQTTQGEVRRQVMVRKVR
jgi:hypothetical protein